ncbi:MAG: hypothetical protein ACI9JN_001421 [Bacteroidia bacterium]|jgi:hypothetical protein
MKVSIKVLTIVFMVFGLYCSCTKCNSTHKVKPGIIYKVAVIYDNSNFIPTHKICNYSEIYLSLGHMNHITDSNTYYLVIKSDTISLNKNYWGSEYLKVKGDTLILLVRNNSNYYSTSNYFNNTRNIYDSDILVIQENIRECSNRYFVPSDSFIVETVLINDTIIYVDVQRDRALIKQVNYRFEPEGIDLVFKSFIDGYDFVKLAKPIGPQKSR